MKRYAFILVATVFALGCSNDFDLTDNWKDIPVVYGILNQQDTAHYLKIEKAFLDTETSAVTIAQIPDSLYYSNITVTLIEKTPANSVTASFDLELVDATLEGYPKDNGTFANEPNWAYKTTEQLDSSKVYELKINRGDGSAEITAETRMVEDFQVFEPITSVGNSYRMKFETGKDTDIDYVKSENARFNDIVLRIYYTEYNDETPGVPVFKAINWPISRGAVLDENTTSIEVNVPGRSFYNYMASVLEADIKYCRKLTRFDLLIHTGNQDLYDYTSVGLANLGITGSVPLPTFTNLSEGRGIFAARYTKVVSDITPDGSVHSELQSNELTMGLNFKNPSVACQ